MSQLLQNETGNSCKNFHYKVRKRFLTKCAILQSVAELYYKVRQNVKSYSTTRDDTFYPLKRFSKT